MLPVFITFLIEGFITFFLYHIFDISTPYFYFIYTVVITINFIVYLFATLKYSRNRAEYTVFILAYLARIYYVYSNTILHGYLPLANMYNGADSFHYDFIAKLIIEQKLGFYNDPISGYYSLILSWVYKLFGVNFSIDPLIGCYFNALLGLAAIVIIKKTVEFAGINKKLSFWIFAIAALGPQFIWFSTVTSRETIMIFLLAYSVYHFIRWWKNGNIYNFVLAVALSLLSAIFHSGAMALAIGYAIVYVFYNSKNKKYVFNHRTIFVGLLVIVVAIAVNGLFGDAVSGKFGGLENKSITEIASDVSGGAYGGSAYLKNQKNETTFQVILNTPVRMLYFIGAPVPWTWRGPNDIIAFFSSALIYVAALYYAFKVLRMYKAPNKQLVIALLVCALIAMVIFAWGVSNSGTAMRHREKFLPLFITILAISYDQYKYPKKDIEDYDDF